MHPGSQTHVPVQTAGTMRRGLGAAIDGLPILAVTAVVTLGVAQRRGVAWPDSRWNAVDAVIDLLNADPVVAAVPVVALIGATWLWHLVFGLAIASSPGKRATGLRVLGPSGTPAGRGRVLLHAMLRPLSLLLLGFGHLWSIADPSRRTLYDRLAGVFVVTPNVPAATRTTAAGGPGRLPPGPQRGI